MMTRFAPGLPPCPLALRRHTAYVRGDRPIPRSRCTTPDDPEYAAGVCDGGRRCPAEDRRIALLHTPRTEVVKGGTAGIRHEDLRHAGSHAVPYQLVQRVDEVLPKADVRPHDEVEGRELLRR